MGAKARKQSDRVGGGGGGMGGGAPTLPHDLGRFLIIVYYQKFCTLNAIKRGGGILQ